MFSEAWYMIRIPQIAVKIQTNHTPNTNGPSVSPSSYWKMNTRENNENQNCLFLRFIYLFIHKRERERQRHRQMEKQVLCRELTMEIDPRTPGSPPEPKADAQPLSYQESQESKLSTPT